MQWDSGQAERCFGALLREEQAGFRRGRSCIDQIATLHIIVEKSVEWQSSFVYICFVDFPNAFDSVNREVTNLIRKLYEGFKAKIVHNGHLSESFEMLTGVRQRCLLSPLLFLVVLDWVDKASLWQISTRNPVAVDAKVRTPGICG